MSSPSGADAEEHLQLYVQPQVRERIVRLGGRIEERADAEEVAVTVVVDVAGTISQASPNVAVEVALNGLELLGQTSTASHTPSPSESMRWHEAEQQNPCRWPGRRPGLGAGDDTVAAARGLALLSQPSPLTRLPSRALEGGDIPSPHAPSSPQVSCSRPRPRYCCRPLLGRRHDAVATGRNSAVGVATIAAHGCRRRTARPARA